MDITSLQIDFEKDILEINGEPYTGKRIVVCLPCEDGWQKQKLFPVTSGELQPEDCDKLSIEFTCDCIKKEQRECTKKSSKSN